MASKKTQIGKREASRTQRNVYATQHIEVGRQGYVEWCATIHRYLYSVGGRVRENYKTRRIPKEKRPRWVATEEWS